ncbi:MAG: tetratricopeptide repeat protein, partial [Gemmatimonadales bacterium]
PGISTIGTESAVLRGDYDGAERLQLELRQAQRGNLAWRAQTSLNLGNLALLRGKVTEAERYRRDQLQAIEGRGLQSEYVSASVIMARGEAFVKGDMEAGTNQVEAALRKYPLDSLAVPDRPYGFLIGFYARAGKLEQAKNLLRQFESEIPDKSREDALTFAWSEGLVALAEGRGTEAIQLIRQHADQSNCDLCALPDLARAYDVAGQADSALAVYERYANTSAPYRLFFDRTELPVSYRRLGELYEQRGDNDKAVEYYDRFVTLWKDADPELQPQVKDVRDRIARLVGER